MMFTNMYEVKIASMSTLQFSPRTATAIAIIAARARNMNLPLLSLHLSDLNLKENMGISHTSR